MSEAEGSQRTAPDDAESWFYAPRHPLINTPTPYEIVRGSLGDVSSAGMRTTIYNGITFNPSPEDVLASGTLHVFQDGMLFLPFGPGHSGLIEFLEGGGDSIVDLILGDAFNGLPVTMAIGHYLKQADDQRRELARWDQPELFWLGHVDLLEVGFGRAPPAPNQIQLSYLTIVAAGSDGEERRFSLPVEGEDMARIFFQQRVDAEMRYFGRLARTDVSGFDDKARAALAKLGLEVADERVDEAAIFAAAQRVIEQGRGADIEGLTLDKLMQTLQSVIDEADREAEARYGDRLTQEKLRLIHGYLEMNREAYRRAPAFAYLLELFDARASGRPDDWQTAWQPANYKFNFAPGEYPGTRG